MTELTVISELVKKGNARQMNDAVEAAVSAGAAASDVLSALMDGMAVIGEKFKNNEVFVPEVLISARAMSTGIQKLKPLLGEEGVHAKGKACIGTVQGDLHDIGKNIVKLMLESKGIEVVDLGVDVSAEKFIEAVKEQNCEIICCSALLTTTMPHMKDIVELAKSENLRDSVAILIGGAPINEAFCKAIGADAYTADAASAADVAVEFLKKLHGDES